MAITPTAPAPAPPAQPPIYQLRLTSLITPSKTFNSSNHSLPPHTTPQTGWYLNSIFARDWFGVCWDNERWDREGLTEHERLGRMRGVLRASVGKIRELKLEVNRWEDREGSDVSITIAYLSKQGELKTLVLSLDLSEQHHFNLSQFDYLRGRFQNVWGKFPLLTTSISPLRPLLIPLPGNHLAPFGPPPPTFIAENPYTWNIDRFKERGSGVDALDRFRYKGTEEDEAYVMVTTTRKRLRKSYKEVERDDSDWIEEEPTAKSVARKRTKSNGDNERTDSESRRRIEVGPSALPTVQVPRSQPSTSAPTPTPTPRESIAVKNLRKEVESLRSLLEAEKVERQTSFEKEKEERDAMEKKFEMRLREEIERVMAGQARLKVGPIRPYRGPGEMEMDEEEEERERQREVRRKVRREKEMEDSKRREREAYVEGMNSVSGAKGVEKLRTEMVLDKVREKDGKKVSGVDEEWALLEEHEFLSSVRV